MEIPSIEIFLLAVLTGMAVRAVFFPDAWEIALRLISEIRHIFKDF